MKRIPHSASRRTRGAKAYTWWKFLVPFNDLDLKNEKAMDFEEVFGEKKKVSGKKVRDSFSTR